MRNESETKMPKAKKSSTQPAPGKKPIQNLDRTPARDSQAGDFLTLQEIAMAARRNLSQSLWDTLCGGSDSETT